MSEGQMFDEIAMLFKRNKKTRSVETTGIFIFR